MTSEALTIQQVAKATGLSVHTLRYYERIQLIAPVARADNTHRRYNQTDVGWIEFLMKLRAIGMPIQDMHVYARLQREGERALPQRVEMLKALKLQIERQMGELNAHLDLLNFKIEVYSTTIERERLVEPR
jgi:DNA-binding transcriptional MerR regulator